MITLILRILGTLIGLLSVVIVVANQFEGYSDGSDTPLADISMVLMGLYFVYYGITGRKLRSKRSIRSSSD